MPLSSIRPLLVTGALCCCLGVLAAGEQRPEGLPHEQVTLRDGRRLTGYYDPAVAILWLDGPYRARLRLRHGDIIRRTPLADATPAATTVAVVNGSARQLTIRLREQQVAELERRWQENGENIRLLTTTLEGLEILLADTARTLGDQPDPLANAALMSQQQQLRQQGGELRRRLMQLDEQRKTLEKRRQQAVQVLARARSSPMGAAEPTALPDPMIEMRLQALEDEVRALRADNQALRHRLDQLQGLLVPPVPQTVDEPSSTDQPPTVPHDDAPAAHRDDDGRVARR